MVDTSTHKNRQPRCPLLDPVPDRVGVVVLHGKKRKQGRSSAVDGFDVQTDGRDERHKSSHRRVHGKVDMKPPLCVRLLRWLFPKSEKERMEYRKCISFTHAHLEDMKRSIRSEKKK